MRTANFRNDISKTFLFFTPLPVQRAPEANRPVEHDDIDDISLKKRSVHRDSHMPNETPKKSRGLMQAFREVITGEIAAALDEKQRRGAWPTDILTHSLFALNLTSGGGGRSCGQRRKPVANDSLGFGHDPLDQRGDGRDIVDQTLDLASPE